MNTDQDGRALSADEEAFFKTRIVYDADHSGCNAVLVCCDDAYYWRFARFLLASLLLHSTNEVLLVRGLHASRDVEEDVRGLSGRIQFRNIACALRSNHRGLCSQMRTKIIADELAGCGLRQLLYVDADAIVRKPLATVWDFLDGADLACRVRGTNYEQNHFTAGVLLFDLEKCRKFLQRWNECAWERVQFYQDQRGLFRAIHEMQMNVRPLPVAYWDTGTRAQSTIWCPWGAGKTHPQFQAAQAAALHTWLQLRCREPHTVR